MLKTAKILFVVLIAGFGVCTPLVTSFLSRGPSISPATAMEALARDPDGNLLVDVRNDTIYGPPVVSAALRESKPERLDAGLLRSKERVFVICNTGLSSGKAVRGLRRRGFGNVYSVDGGMEAWLAGGYVPCRKGVCLRQSASPDAGPAGTVRRNDLTRFEQFIICFTSFGLKPVYELIALVMAIVIWRRSEAHWRSVRWGMLAFFLGENACAVNYLFYDLENFTWEFWHCYGMLVAFGFIFHGLIEFVDQHVVHYSQKDVSCAFLSLCRNCYKYIPVSCNLWLLFLFTIPAVLVLCSMPLSAPYKNFMSVGTVFGDEILFTHSMLQQMYEIRIYPVLAIALFAIAWIMLIAGKERAMEPSKAFFAAGLGVAGFSLMRFLIFWSYADNILWAETWEEITEFMFILSMAGILCARRLNAWLSGQTDK